MKYNIANYTGAFVLKAVKAKLTSLNVKYNKGIINNGVFDISQLS